MTNDGDKLARTYARLKSLKKNLPDQSKYIADTYAAEFYNALDSLAQLGFDIEEFRVPPNQINPDIMAAIPGRGTAYNSNSVCRAQFPAGEG